MRNIGYNPISANTLFHFTSNSDNLVSILKHGFRPRYCIENYSVFNQGEVAIPMVCFCDIPLSQMRNHVQTYGPYAIGLTKEWGVSQGISPILYTTINSESSKMLNQNLMILTRGSPESVKQYVIEAINHPDPNHIGKLYIESLSRQNAFLAYTKLYEGKFWRNGRYLEQDVRFYNEREWRYIPNFEDTIMVGVKNWIAKEQFLANNVSEEYDMKLQANFKLDFSPKDIRFIIVKDESELLLMVNKVYDIKSKYSEDDIKTVITRIISMEQIFDDI